MLLYSGKISCANSRPKCRNKLTKDSCEVMPTHSPARRRWIVWTPSCPSFLTKIASRARPQKFCRIFSTPGTFSMSGMSRAGHSRTMPHYTGVKSKGKTLYQTMRFLRLNQDRIDCFLGCHSPQAERKRPNSVVRTSSMRDNKKTQFSQPTTEDSFRPGVLPNNQNKIDSSEWQRVHGRLSISCQDVSSISQNMKGQGHSEEVIEFSVPLK